MLKIRWSAAGKRWAALWVGVSLGLAIFLGFGCDSQVADTQDQQTQQEAAAEPANQGAETDAPRWEEDSVIFRFTDEDVTYGAVQAIYNHRTLKPDEPLPSFPESEQIRFMKQIGTELLLAREARRRNVEDTPEYRRNYYMWTLDQLFPLWVTREIAEKVTMTDEEILQYAPLALPEVKVRILVKNDASEAKKAYERIKAGENMETLIQEESEGLSASMGGLTDWMNAQQSPYFPPPVVQKYLDAEVGTLFPPIYQDIGFLVVRLESKRSAEDVRKIWLNKVRDEYVLEHQQQVYQDRLEELREAADVVVHQDVADEVAQGNMAAVSRALVEINGRTFAASDVMGTSMLGQHGADAVQGRIEKFITKVVLAEAAQAMGMEEDPEFQKALQFDQSQLLADTLKQITTREVEELEIDDEQIEAYTISFPEEFAVPEMRTVSLIDVRSPEKAEEVLAKLTEGGSFEDLAAEFSNHPESAAKGGLVGTYAADQMPPEISEPVFGLEKDAHTNPAVEVRSGGTPVWLILRVDDVQDAAPMAVERAKSLNLNPRIRVWLRAKALADLVETATQEFGYVNCIEDPCTERGTP